MSLLRPHLAAIASGTPEQRASARRILAAYVRDEAQTRLSSAHPGPLCDAAAIATSAAGLAAELASWPPESREAIADALRAPLPGPCGSNHALDFLGRIASDVPWWKKA